MWQVRLPEEVSGWIGEVYRHYLDHEWGLERWAQYDFVWLPEAMLPWRSKLVDWLTTAEEREMATRIEVIVHVVRARVAPHVDARCKDVRLLLLGLATTDGPSDEYWTAQGLDSTVEFVHGDRRMTMTEGSCVSFDDHVPHGLNNHRCRTLVLASVAIDPKPLMHGR